MMMITMVVVDEGKMWRWSEWELNGSNKKFFFYIPRNYLCHNLSDFFVSFKYVTKNFFIKSRYIKVCGRWMHKHHPVHINSFVCTKLDLMAVALLLVTDIAGTHVSISTACVSSTLHCTCSKARSGIFEWE